MPHSPLYAAVGVRGRPAVSASFRTTLPQGWTLCPPLQAMATPGPRDRRAPSSSSWEQRPGSSFGCARPRSPVRRQPHEAPRRSPRHGPPPPRPAMPGPLLWGPGPGRLPPEPKPGLAWPRPGPPGCRSRRRTARRARPRRSGASPCWPFGRAAPRSRGTPRAGRGGRPGARHRRGSGTARAPVAGCRPPSPAPSGRGRRRTRGLGLAPRACTRAGRPRARRQGGRGRWPPRGGPSAPGAPGLLALRRRSRATALSAPRLRCQGAAPRAAQPPR
mmetsp:Transcript_31128/g.96851  ORF Transcript_31128/g.96851 Transcript_31128/m.96851 type:complete len:274 (-) Transcript_31128:164-985(-)